MKLQNLGSLITYTDTDGAERALGFLMYFSGRGVYDATFGKVEVSEQHAGEHNRLLDAALLAGLDDNCEIGQGDSFYLRPGTGAGERSAAQVITFNGTVVAPARVSGKSITFTRAGKTYRGRTMKDADLFNFRRVK